MPELPDCMYTKERKPHRSFSHNETLYRRVSNYIWGDDDIELDSIQFPDMSVTRSRFGLPASARWEGLTYLAWGVLGFKVTEITVRHHERKFGKSKYGVWRYFAGFFDLMTVLFLTRFTQRPLHLFGIIGLGSFMVGFLINLYLTIQKYVYKAGIGDRPLLFLGILLIILGFQFFSLGFLAEMITSQKSGDTNYIIMKTYD